VNTRNAFTLLELLVVIGIIAILMVLVVPSFTTRKTADDITNAAYTIKGLCEQARSYAKANHTYTWVGFYEENASALSPTNVTPAYPGKGRVVMATVFSNDGTKILEVAVHLDGYHHCQNLLRLPGI
jgi:prepilin-type N-terminal cleavage/methylation domain-containing protein